VWQEMFFMNSGLLYIRQQKRKLKLLEISFSSSEQNIRLDTFPGFCITKGSREVIPDNSSPSAL
jgi:hypothetical protein